MRGRHSQEPHFLEGEVEAQRGLTTRVRLCLAEVAKPGLKLRRSQPGSEERWRGSRGGARRSGLWHWASRAWSGARSLPRRPLVSPKGLLTGQSRWGQPRPADGVKWLAGARGHVCGTSPFLWADSSRTVDPHRGGRAAKLLHCSGSQAEPSYPLLSLNSRSSFPHPPETEALVEQGHATSPNNPGDGACPGVGEEAPRALNTYRPHLLPKGGGHGSPKLSPVCLSSVVSSRVTGKQIQPPSHCSAEPWLGVSTLEEVAAVCPWGGRGWGGWSCLSPSE